MTPIDRRTFLRLAGQSAAALAVLAGCGAAALPTADRALPTLVPSTPLPPTALPPTPSATPSPSSTTDSTPAAGIPLEVKIGQMLLVGFRGLAVDQMHPIVADIRDRHLGGVVLFDFDAPSWSGVRNVESPEQVRALVASLQSFATVPLLVAVDQEGGKVARLDERHGFPPTVSHRFLGEQDNLALTRESAAALAKTLAAVGITLNLAPVVDVNVNPNNPVIGKLDRSFSSDPAVVARHAQAFIEAHHAQGVLCCPKHFPGHGSSTADSHRGLVDVTDTWTRREFEPYAALIRSGLADCIMTAHVFNAALDPEYPATLSEATIDGILRGELGYEGVVISDDMQMGAIRMHYGFEEAVVKTIEAGVDILAIANNSVLEEDVVTRTVEIIRRAVGTGRLDAERIDRSYRRIQSLKRSLDGR